MRIISGKYKGKRIRAPKNLPVRPTTDFAKEGLFNMLHHRFDLSSLTVLDLGCGTGNITYEFASRGASKITSVDISGRCVKFVIQMKHELGFYNIRVEKSEMIKFIKKCGRKFDLVFADPPFDYDRYEELVELVFEHEVVANGGCLIVEHDKRTNLSVLDRFIEQRKYGKVKFSIFSN